MLCPSISTAESTSADQIDEDPAELLPDEQKCLYENYFQICDAYLMDRRVQPNPLKLSALETALERGALARYNMTRVDLKTFTYSAGSNSRSIDNAVLGPCRNFCCSP